MGRECRNPGHLGEHANIALAPITGCQSYIALTGIDIDIDLTDIALIGVQEKGSSRTEISEVTEKSSPVFFLHGSWEEVVRKRIWRGQETKNVGHLGMFWVELCPPKRYIEILIPGICECGLIWK